LTPFTDFVGDIGISICPIGSLKLDIDMPKLKGDDIDIVPYTFSGHFAVTGGLIIPFEKFSEDFGRQLDKILEIEGRVGLILDLGKVGNSGNLYTELFDLVLSIKNPDKFIDKTINIINGCSKFGLQVNSLIKVKLNELTKGFLPDIEVELSKTAFSVFLREENGILPGVYLYLSSNVSPIGFVLKAVQAVLDNFDFIFDALDISTPKLPETNIEMSLIVNTKYIAFEVEAPNFIGIACKFDRSSKKGSCSIGFDFFTLILEGVKWILRKALKFFEETGEKLIEFVDDSSKFVENSAKATYKYFMKKSQEAKAIYKKANEELEKFGNKLSYNGKKAYERAIGVSKGILEKSYKHMRGVVNRGSKVLFMSMDTIWDFLGDEGRRLRYLKKVGKKIEKQLKDKVKMLEENAQKLADEAGKLAGKALETAKREAKRAKELAEKTKKDLRESYG